MSERKSYWQKLKDPRWQRRRLQRLNDAAFTCQCCGDASSTLHVHHRIYRKGADPWDYPDEDLQVLCEACHADVTHARAALDECLARVGASDFDEVRGYIDCQLLELNDRDPSSLIAIDSAEYAIGFGRRLGLSQYESMLLLARDDLTAGEALRVHGLAAERVRLAPIESA